MKVKRCMTQRTQTAPYARDWDSKYKTEEAKSLAKLRREVEDALWSFDFTVRLNNYRNRECVWNKTICY